MLLGKPAVTKLQRPDLCRKQHMTSVLAFPLAKSSAIDMQQVYRTYAANLKRKDLKSINRFAQKIILGSAFGPTGPGPLH